VREELHRLPGTADLVVRARAEAADAGSAVLRQDLRAGMDRLLGDRVRSS
jgi:ribonuclease P protein component